MVGTAHPTRLETGRESDLFLSDSTLSGRKWRLGGSLLSSDRRAVIMLISSGKSNDLVRALLVVDINTLVSTLAELPASLEDVAVVGGNRDKILLRGKSTIYLFKL